jgi:hypothetical protein
MTITAFNPEVLRKFGKPANQPWMDYRKEFGISDKDVPTLIDIFDDKALLDFPNDSAEVWAQVHAWRALGQLKSEAAITPIISSFTYLYNDDCALTEIQEVLGMIGQAAIMPLSTTLRRTAENEFEYVLAIDSLGKIAEFHPESRAEVLQVFKDYMQAPYQEFDTLNGILMGTLLDLQAVELIDEIRHLFELDCVDFSCAGDLEEIEIELGMRDERSTPKPNYYLHKYAKSQQQDSNLIDFIPLETYVKLKPKIGRNDPCTCGSGKKFKKCCGK